MLRFVQPNPDLEIIVDYGKRRDDVYAAFPTPTSLNCGYLAIAGFAGAELESAALKWNVVGQDEVLILLYENKSQTPSASISGDLTRSTHYRQLALKSLSTIRAAGLKRTIVKILRHLQRRPIRASETQWQMLRRTLVNQSVFLIVDHDMGGGANIYRGQVIKSQLERGVVCVFLGFHVATLSYFVEIYEPNVSYPKRIAVEDLHSLLDILHSTNLTEVSYNCAVSFRSPIAIVQLMEDLKHFTNAKLTISIHDYFAICPSPFLLDNAGNYCGVPDLTVCHKCLPIHPDGWVSMAGVRSVSEWRVSWRKLMLTANEIRIFSQSSRKLLIRAFGEEIESSIRLVPHKLHQALGEAKLSKGSRLHVGVVGAISAHKGANVVAGLSKVIKRLGIDVKITVFGTLDSNQITSDVSVLGAYETLQLPDLLTREKVNIVLFPSILPETFSFVAHELVAMNVPFACFDMGAQADLARVYNRGKVLASMEPGDILKELTSFWHESYDVSS
jgi:hypothetical protein